MSFHVQLETGKMLAWSGDGTGGMIFDNPERS